MVPKLTYIVSILIFSILGEVKAQQFYNNEDFFTDSTFINKHKIKIVKIRIPKLMGDSTTEFYPFQQFCFNPYGKLAWYEYDYNENNQRRKYYFQYYYNDLAQCFKSRIFQRCDGLDSLREEVKYYYDQKGRIIHEDHYQIFIQSYNEWSYNYDWHGDSLKIKLSDDTVVDSTRYDEKGREIDFSLNNFRCLVKYQDNGRRQHVRYLWQNKNSFNFDENMTAEEAKYIYDSDNQLIQIETIAYNIFFLYNEDGLPISSWRQNKLESNAPSLEIYYEYEFRDDNWAKRN